MNTHWSKPKKNVFAGMLYLRQALAAGQNARLIKANNEDCAFPIKVRNSITDFRAYEFSVGLMKTRTSIIGDERMPAFEKYLSLNYKCCYGTQEAVDTYYKSGLLSKDNFKGVGRSHLVKVEDMVRFLLITGDKPRANMFKVWVVDLLRDDQPKPRTPFLIKILNILLYPTKFIPTKSVLRMDEYRCVTFRIGAVTNGISVEFHIPKKFSFNN